MPKRVGHWTLYLQGATNQPQNAGQSKRMYGDAPPLPEDEEDETADVPTASAEEPPQPNRTINIYEVAQAQEANTNVLNKPPDTPAREEVVSLGGFGLTQDELFQLGLALFLVYFIRRR